jgi:tRNA nucleotidyltransferase (CCA-adding enzyme)
MFQVLLNTGAATTLLAPTLAVQLSQEAFREAMLIHLSQAGDSLEERCAIVLMQVPEAEIRSWADCVRMPIEIRDFSEIFSALLELMNQNSQNLQPVDVLAWFNRADIWRKPDRGQALLKLAEKIGLRVTPLLKAMRNAQSLITAEVIAGIEAQDRSNGERIGSAFEAARLAAITAALQS